MCFIPKLFINVSSMKGTCSSVNYITDVQILIMLGPDKKKESNMYATWYVNFMVMLKVHKQHGLSYNFSFIFTASGWDSAPTAENQQLSRGPPLFLSSFEFSFNCNLPPPHNAIRS